MNLQEQLPLVRITDENYDQYKATYTWLKSIPLNEEEIKYRDVLEDLLIDWFYGK